VAKSIVACDVKEAFLGLMMWVMTDEPLLYFFSCPYCFHLFMFAYFTWRTASTISSVCEVNWLVLLRTSARRWPAALCADVLTWLLYSSFQVWMCVWGRMKHPGMLSVWGCHLLVTKGRTLKIRLRMNIVVQMCTVLLLIACCGRIVSL